MIIWKSEIAANNSKWTQFIFVWSKQVASLSGLKTWNTWDSFSASTSFTTTLFLFKNSAYITPPLSRSPIQPHKLFHIIISRIDVFNKHFTSHSFYSPNSRCDTCSEIILKPCISHESHHRVPWIHLEPLQHVPTRGQSSVK